MLSENSERGKRAHINVATLEGEGKLGSLVLDKVEGHLGVAFLLEIGYDTLAHQLGTPHHVQHLAITHHMHMLQFNTRKTFRKHSIYIIQPVTCTHD